LRIYAALHNPDFPGSVQDADSVIKRAAVIADSYRSTRTRSLGLGRSTGSQSLSGSTLADSRSAGLATSLPAHVLVALVHL